jgi:nitroreductase
MMKWFLKNLPLEMRKSWVENQVHIALWNLINTCALLWIDDCPIGWFNREKYDEILWLKEKWLTSVVLLPIWYRDEKLDKYSKLKKVRFDLDEIVEYIR